MAVQAVGRGSGVVRYGVDNTPLSCRSSALLSTPPRRRSHNMHKLTGLYLHSCSYSVSVEWNRRELIAVEFDTICKSCVEIKYS